MVEIASGLHVKIGVVGFCFGGTMANRLAVQLPDLAAAVRSTAGNRLPWMLPKSRRLLLHTQHWMRITGGASLQEALKASHVPFTAYIYERQSWFP
jgi:carboxymethylenebutenolidase